VRNNHYDIMLIYADDHGAKVIGFMNTKQFGSTWKKWCEFRIAVCGLGEHATDHPTGSESEKQLVRKLLSPTQNSAEQAVWLRSLVELCGLTVRQVSGFFKIEPQVVVQAISLLVVPAGADSRRELDKNKRTWKAA
jgi:hypothetical protein